MSKPSDIVLSLFLYILETLDHPNYRVWFHFLPITLDGAEGVRIHLNVASTLSCAARGTRTRAAGTSSESQPRYIVCRFFTEQNDQLKLSQQR